MMTSLLPELVSARLDSGRRRQRGLEDEIGQSEQLTRDARDLWTAGDELAVVRHVVERATQRIVDAARADMSDDELLWEEINSGRLDALPPTDRRRTLTNFLVLFENRGHGLGRISDLVRLSVSPADRPRLLAELDALRRSLRRLTTAVARQLRPPPADDWQPLDPGRLVEGLRQAATGECVPAVSSNGSGGRVDG